MTKTKSMLVSSRIACLLVLLGSFSQAMAGAHSTKSGAAIRPSVIYHNYCSVCHGDKGDGRSRAQNSMVPPPRDFTTPASATELSRARMIEAVQNGRPGTAMTPWKTELTKKEIESLVDYMRNTFMPASHAADSSPGRAVYSKNCSVCHGEKGDGRSRAQGSMIPPPRDFTSPAVIAELTRQRMITSVTYGRPDTAMAGFKTQLSAKDIGAVVDYISTGFMASANTEGISGIRNGRRLPDQSNLQPGVPPVAPSGKPVAVNMALPMPHGLKGNASKGGAFYMSNCATCHGTTGDGRGPRAYFIMPKPRNLLHPASRQEFNRVALFNAISDGKLRTEMPAWRHVLTKQEIADIAEFVFQRFTHPAGSAPAKAPKQ